MSVFGPFPAKVLEVHDGDTVIFDLDLGFGIHFEGKSWTGKTMLSCRVFGINADELSTPTGKAALAYAQTLLKPGDICQVTSHLWDKYGGRFDGEIELPDGQDFGNLMIVGGFARAI